MLQLACSCFYHQARYPQSYCSINTTCSMALNIHFILSTTIFLKFTYWTTLHERQTLQEKHFNLYFCKKVAKIGLKTWLNVDLSISTLCLYDQFNVVLLLCVLFVNRMPDLNITKTHDYISKVCKSKPWALRRFKLLSYNSIFFRLIAQ